MDEISKIYTDVKKTEFIAHETKRKVLFKFLFLILVLIGYFVFMAWKYGLKDEFRDHSYMVFFCILHTDSGCGFSIGFPRSAYH